MRPIFILCFWIFVLADAGLSQTAPDVERVEKGPLILENIPEIPSEIRERARIYQNTRSASLMGWDASGKGLFISTRFAETTQVHRVKEAGGTREQITFFDEPVSGAAVCPDGTQASMILTKDEGGSENFQLFLYDLTHRDCHRITDGQSRNGSVQWSNQGNRFAYHSTKRNQKDYDIYIAGIDNPSSAEMVLQTNGHWSVLDWSPDDTKLLLMQWISVNESYLYILDLPTKELVQMLPSDERVAYRAAQWSKDGKSLFFISNHGSEFQELRQLDFESHAVKSISHSIPWDITEFDLSRNGMYLAFVSNEEGMSKLYVLMLKNTQPLGTLPVPDGVIQDLAFSPDSQKLGMTINTSTAPADVYVIDILKYDHFEQWTFSEVGELNPRHFVSPRLIRYPSFDPVEGQPRMLPAFYYPSLQETGQPHPVLVYIHGGPESQFRPTFNVHFQYLAHEMGMAVIAPNVRGSRGYGKRFLSLDNGMRREDSVKDIGALLDWIKQQPELDADRVIVMGGSYGGYMVLASLIHYSERLLAGIEIVGISNFVTFLENTKDYRRDLRRVEYGDERNREMREFLLSISPTTHANQIQTPVFIAQGANDPRVPVSESEQMVKAIREQGTEVWYLLAEDEGHGFRKKSNRDFYYQAVYTFVQHVLDRN